MTRVSHIYCWLPLTHSVTFWLPETAWFCQLVTHSWIHITWVCMYSATFSFPVLPFRLDLFQSRTQPQTFRQIPKEMNDQHERKRFFLKYIYSLLDTFNIYSFTFIFVLVTYRHTHTEEYLTSYIRIFVMFCNVSFLCTCWYINSFLFVLLSFECSFVHIVYIICFSIMSHHKLWGQNYSSNNPTDSPKKQGVIHYIFGQLERTDRQTLFSYMSLSAGSCM